jgi:hypothetical protein
MAKRPELNDGARKLGLTYTAAFELSTGAT